MLQIEKRKKKKKKKETRGGKCIFDQKAQPSNQIGVGRKRILGNFTLIKLLVTLQLSSFNDPFSKAW